MAFWLAQSLSANAQMHTQHMHRLNDNPLFRLIEQLRMGLSPRLTHISIIKLQLDGILFVPNNIIHQNIPLESQAGERVCHPAIECLSVLECICAYFMYQRE